MILSPTRTYAPVVKAVFAAMKPEIHGMIHCTGGGQTKVLHFVNDLHIIKDNLFELPPLFRMIREQSGSDLKDMYPVFNMGHRLEFYVPEASAAQIIAISQEFGIDARIVGRCEANTGKKLTIRQPEGEFVY